MYTQHAERIQRRYDTALALLDEPDVSKSIHLANRAGNTPLDLVVADIARDRNFICQEAKAWCHCPFLFDPNRTKFYRGDETLDELWDRFSRSRSDKYTEWQQVAGTVQHRDAILAVKSRLIELGAQDKAERSRDDVWEIEAVAERWLA